METGYKMVRTDVLRQLRLTSNTFTFEPELTSRLAQWGHRSRSADQLFRPHYQEGKRSGLAMGSRPSGNCCARISGTRSSPRTSAFTSSVRCPRPRASTAGCWTRYGRSLATGCSKPEPASATLADCCSTAGGWCCWSANRSISPGLRGGSKGACNVRVVEADLADASSYAGSGGRRTRHHLVLDVLEHIEPDEEVLASFARLIVERGHCIIVVPAGRRLFNALDTALEHVRRYEADELRCNLENAGFEVVLLKRFNRMGALGWLVSGGWAGSNSARAQMIWFDRLLPLARICERILPIAGLSLIAVRVKASAVCS